VGVPIAGGTFLHGIAITPDGRTAYITNLSPGTVPLIDTQTKQEVGSPIAVADAYAIAITPDGQLALVGGLNNVSVIDTLTKQLVGSPIPVGGDPFAVAVTPDQPPLASFTDPRARPGVPVAFNASASSDPDGTIARIDWVFGDGQTAPSGGSMPSHTYQRPGTYKATLTLTDNEGCSTAFVFTGQTAYCNGQASAAQTQTIKVTYPGVRIKCPNGAKPKGCRFKLQAVSKKRRAKVESATAKAKAKAGKSLVVSLKPKTKFRTKLAIATKILVKETVTISGSTRIVFRNLKVIQ
jgi:DNA-binding beta-propeller fold protein YncE